MDADIVEIPPPVHLLKKQKRAILHDVIDIDDDVDSEDLVIIGEKVSKSNKGKTIEAIHQEVSDYTFCQPGVENFGPVSGIESSNGYPLVSHDSINVDGHGSDISYDDDDHIGICWEDYAGVDEYALLQAHLDNVDIPLGTEAPFTLLPEYDLGLKKSTFENSPWYDTQSDAKNSHVMNSSQPSWSLEPSIQGSIMGSSNLQIKMDNVDHSSGTELSSPQLFSQAVPSKKKSAASQRSGRALNLSLGVESSKSKRFLKSFRSKMKSASFGSKNHGLAGNPEAGKLLHTGKPPAAIKFKSAKAAFGSTSSYHANFEDKTLRKFARFKQFGTVNVDSDHYFFHENSSMKRHPKNWAKRIQKEWKILEKDLPDSIFVRVYKSRMDLMRAVIIGVEGTPYHDGLFFFDLCFPSDYPDVPPLVYSYSCGYMLNPNLTKSGQVCLSLLLLNYGSSIATEGWLPGVSTILQVLVSIQGLILNAKPFFYLTFREYTVGSETDEIKAKSLEYNEGAFIQSLWRMIYTIRRPPKGFKDFVVGHFMSRAHDILVACNAYMEGAQVGCLVKGGVQDVDEGDKGCSEWFKSSLALPIKQLVAEVARIGAKDCEKFLSAANKRLDAMLAANLE